MINGFSMILYSFHDIFYFYLITTQPDGIQTQIIANVKKAVLKKHD